MALKTVSFSGKNLSSLMGFRKKLTYPKGWIKHGAETRSYP
jgi:hypothetical protein